MNIKINFLCSILVTIAFSQNYSVITDTYQFNDWFKAKNIDNNVGLTFNYNEAQGTLNFALYFDKNPISRIKSYVFLQAGSNSSGSFSLAFNPNKTTENGKIYFRQKIFTKDFLSGSKYNCELTNDENNKEISFKICYGLLSFVHDDQLKEITGLSGKSKEFSGSYNNALVKYYFKIAVKINKKSSMVLDTIIKTKISKLYCRTPCNISTAFKINSIICSNEKIESCLPRKSYKKKYTFGDKMYIKFTLHPPTNYFSLHSLVASSGIKNEAEYLPNRHFKVSKIGLGVLYANIEMNGPSDSSTTGRKFDLTYTFKLDSSSGSRRVLELGKNRVLQQEKSSDLDVSSNKIYGFEVNNEKNNVNDENDGIGKETEKLFFLCVVLVGILALISVCGIFSNIRALITKNRCETFKPVTGISSNNLEIRRENAKI